MTVIRQLAKVAVTAAATLSGSYVIYNNTAKKPVLASGNDDSLTGRLLFQPCGQKWDSNWDMQESGKRRRNSKDERAGLDSTNNSEEKQMKPTGTRHLIFIRHGQYNDEADKDEQRSLTELGRTQAEMTGQRLKDLNLKYTILMNSTMKRAVETADIISKYLPDVPREECSMLREGAPIVPEPPSSNWKPEKVQFFQDNARIEAAFRKYVHRADVEQVGDSVEVYVCHGNVIRYFVCRALQFPPEGWLRMTINHCGITWLTIRPNGRVSLRSLGDTGHLTPASISSS